MRLLLKHAHLIVDGNKEYLDGAILINGEYIEDVFANSNKIQNIDAKEVDVKGMIIMPGFFDTHSHGINAIDYLDLKGNDLDKASLAYAKKGTTSFFSTVYASPYLESALTNLNNLDTKYSRCLGVHLEGPFLSEKKLGASKKEDLLTPTIEYTKKLLCLNNNLKQMTIAPENEGAIDVMNFLKENGIKVMLGHSGVTNYTLDNYDGFTHLYNAMSSFSHRNKGLVNTAFEREDKYVELIGDGIHVDEEVLKITLKLLRRDRIMLISDSTLAAGLKDGEYNFNNAVCVKEGNRFMRKSDRTLSGSASCILDEIKVMKNIGASYTDILLMSSLNAYRFYGLDKLYGTLNKGQYADLVLLDENLNLICTFVRGKMIYA